MLVSGAKASTTRGGFVTPSLTTATAGERIADHQINNVDEMLSWEFGSARQTGPYGRDTRHSIRRLVSLERRKPATRTLSREHRARIEGGAADPPTLSVLWRSDFVEQLQKQDTFAMAQWRQ